MIHPMLEKYAKVLVNYCLEIKKGDTFPSRETSQRNLNQGGIQGSATITEEHPLILLKFEGQDNIFFNHASEEQLSMNRRLMRYLYENEDAVLNILGSYNTKALTNEIHGKDKEEEAGQLTELEGDIE